MEELDKLSEQIKEIGVRATGIISRLKVVEPRTENGVMSFNIVRDYVTFLNNRLKDRKWKALDSEVIIHEKSFGITYRGTLMKGIDAVPLICFFWEVKPLSKWR